MSYSRPIIHLTRYLQSGDSGFLDPSVAQTPLQPLYLNPEHDILYILARPPVKHAFVSFVHDLKVYDPYDIRLLRFALKSNTINALNKASAESARRGMPTPIWAAFASTFSRLRDLIFIMHGYLGRTIISPLIDFPKASIRFNHSIPVKPLTPAFDLTPDPRPRHQVEADLKYIFTWQDPYGIHEHMQQVLQAWGIHPETPPTEKVLFAYATYPSQPPIVDAKTAKEFLQEEHKG